MIMLGKQKIRIKKRKTSTIQEKTEDEDVSRSKKSGMKSKLSKD